MVTRRRVQAEWAIERSPVAIAARRLRLRPANRRFMQSGGSASPSVVRPAGRPARRSAPRKGTTRAMAVVVVVAEGIPPAAIAAADRTPRAVGVTPPAAAGIPPAAV